MNIIVAPEIKKSKRGVLKQNEAKENIVEMSKMHKEIDRTPKLTSTSVASTQGVISAEK